jgi:prepilin-type N-terminal cleavage/methylation domain-containing protein
MITPVPTTEQSRQCSKGVRNRGFTLIELLVVIAIILMVSAVALTTILPAYNNLQFSGAARVLQGALSAARDTAINTGAPAGIRLLPDPTLNGIDPSTGNAGTPGLIPLDPNRILASNRFIPIQLAPDYSEGLVTLDAGPPAAANYTAANFPYFLQKVITPGNVVTPTYYPATTNHMLYLEQSVINTTTGLLNPPTSWYWNIRIGDKVQLANTGSSYTVVGPMTIDNPEFFVNVGPQGSTALAYTGPNGITMNPEILFLVNGDDDNQDGYVDNGFDGIDNDGDGIADQITDTGNLSEWVEVETWQSSVLHIPQGALPGWGSLNWSVRDVPYTITRRPVVVPQARETALPSQVVVDLTTALTTQERSRLPVDPITGYVDIMLYPNGTVMPTTIYSNPSSFGMSSSFFHFWLADRTDLYDPFQQANVPYRLPMVASAANNYPNPNDTLGATRQLKGERLLVTLFTRTGALATNQIESFDGSGNGTTVPPSNHGINLPFLLPQQGVRGDTR